MMTAQRSKRRKRHRTRGHTYKIPPSMDMVVHPTELHSNITPGRPTIEANNPTSIECDECPTNVSHNDIERSPGIEVLCRRCYYKRKYPGVVD